MANLGIPRFQTYNDPVWRTVFQLYDQDKVVAAMELAQQVGAVRDLGQDVNQIYAEAVVRQSGQSDRVTEWLTLETIPDEVGEYADPLRTIVKEACEQSSQMFGWDNSVPVWVTVLPTEAREDWMPARFGYYVPKAPYGKVCIPSALVGSERLSPVVRHEFTHHIARHMGGGNVNRWLGEGLATLAEGVWFGHAVGMFLSDRATWLSPGDLNQIVSADNRDHTMLGRIGVGYAQSNLIVRYLAQTHGVASLGLVLQNLGESGPIRYLSQAVFPRPLVDVAFRAVYRMSEQEVFAKAHAWVLARGEVQS